MARQPKITIPWPDKAIPHQRFVIYQVERITVNILTMLNEGAEGNEEIYKMFLPKVARRLNDAGEAAAKILQYAPTGAGALPVWLKVAKKTINTLDGMIKAVEEMKALRAAHDFEPLQKALVILLDTCLELMDDFKKAPIDNGNPNHDDDNNSYYIDLSSLLNHKK